MDRIDSLCRALTGIEVLRDAPMCQFTTFRIGGPADALIQPESEEQLVQAINACSTLNLPYTVIGNGSNLLVRSGGIRGLVIRIGDALSGIEQEDETLLYVRAGHSLTACARDALARGLMGLEWACGIPGTIGGACAMNAGAYGGEMQQVLKRLRVFKGGRVETLDVHDGDLAYRHSVFCAPDCITLAAWLQLALDDGAAQQRQNDYMSRRRQKQPLSFPSAGSVFKRPPGHFAGQLIENAGLKGFAIGGAQVSSLHAGFIINRGNASCEDVLALIAHIQKTVLDRFGVQLTCEIKVLGEDTQHSEYEV